MGGKSTEVVSEEINEKTPLLVKVTKEEQKNFFKFLPQDCIFHIISFLNIQDIASFALVNKRINSILNLLTFSLLSSILGKDHLLVEYHDWCKRNGIALEVQQINFKNVPKINLPYSFLEKQYPNLENLNLQDRNKITFFFEDVTKLLKRSSLIVKKKMIESSIESSINYIPDVGINTADHSPQSYLEHLRAYTAGVYTTYITWMSVGIGTATIGFLTHNIFCGSVCVGCSLIGPSGMGLAACVARKLKQQHKEWEETDKELSKFDMPSARLMEKR